MKLLLDTHALLWFLAGDQRLSTPARKAIEDRSNRRLFSVAGAWEAAIKVSLGKLSLGVPFEELVRHRLRDNGIDLLPIETDHIRSLITLPHHHRDPFDRMLVAQATVEEANLVSADSTLDAYGISRIW